MWENSILEKNWNFSSWEGIDLRIENCSLKYQNHKIQWKMVNDLFLSFSKNTLNLCVSEHDEWNTLFKIISGRNECKHFYSQYDFYVDDNKIIDL